MKKLALSCAIAGALMSLCASVQAAEPIDPIEPVEVKNPALVELGKCSSSNHVCPAPALFPATAATTSLRAA